LAVLNIARWCVLMLLVLIAGSGGRLSVPVGKSYEVVAPLLAVGIGPTYACKLIDLSYPPAGCGGVLLGRVDISQVPGVFRYQNGTMSTPPLRLVGVWDGQALTLTQRPRPASYTATALDTPCAVTSPAIEPELLVREQRVVQAWDALKQHGVVLLSVGPCGDALDLFVAVADTQTINYLTTTYGPVGVFGWLSPVA
jgi:hypothetical protein